ncbi:MAG: hypothetical protein ACRDDY_19630 [Clostridium sp.]|uniref:hypothetical protein n=1 Tax=Clostridium sp. TaxID=1506 RepID=UPI003EE65476
MARKFNSIEDVARYIKTTCNPDIIDKIEESGIKTMEQVTKEQVGGWSGDIFECIGTNSKTNESLELSWQDTGDWYSLAEKTKGDHMYAPWALENGKVWDWSSSAKYKPATTLEETSTEIIEKDSKEISMKILKQKGFDIG